jgi:hypothetical protein
MWPADTGVSRALCSLAVTVGVSVAVSGPAAAQAREPASLLQAITIAAADLDMAPAAQAPARVPAQRPFPAPAPNERPVALVPLYGSFALLQVMDAHSTIRAVRAGAVERNPLMAPLASNPGGMLAVKAATTAGTIAVAEKLWRRRGQLSQVIGRRRDCSRDHSEGRSQGLSARSRGSSHSTRFRPAAFAR